MLYILLVLMNLGHALGDVQVRDWADEVVTLGELAERSAPAAVLVNVWATWCPPCREELPWLLAAHEEGRVQLIAVNMGDPHGAVARFLAEEELELLPVFFASPRDLGPLSLPGLPVTFLVRGAEVVRTHYGPLSPEAIEALLGED